MFSEYVGRFKNNDGYILVRHNVMRTIRLSARKGNLNTETGGILLGCYRPPHIDLTSLTTMQSNDTASQFSFHRKDKKHNAIAKSKWKRSKGFVSYIGEWHTHPERNPKPSYVDISEWRNLLRIEKRDMIFIIGGYCSDWIGIGRYNNGKITIDKSTNLNQSLVGKNIPYL